MQADVSVIVPVHNAKDTLERAVESLLANKHINLEIILVENASTDGSIRICWKLEHAYDNVRLFSTKKKGVSHARNIGIQNANGRYIGFLDADDYADENMYSELYHGAVENNADMGVCEYVIENNCQETIHVFDLMRLKQLFSGMGRQILPDDLLLSMIGKADDNEPVIMASVWRAIFKASFLKKEEIGFQKDLEIGEDLLFLIEALKRMNNVYICSQELYHYCLTENSATNKIDKNTWKKYEKLLEALGHFGEREHETGAFWTRYNNKTNMFSSWIALEYAKADIPFLESYRFVIRIRNARRELFRTEYTIPGRDGNSTKERYWHIMILMQGTAYRIKCRLLPVLKKDKRS